MLREAHALSHVAIIHFSTGARDAGGTGSVPVGRPGTGNALGIADPKRCLWRTDAGERYIIVNEARRAALELQSGRVNAALMAERAGVGEEEDQSEKYKILNPHKLYLIK